MPDAVPSSPAPHTSEHHGWQLEARWARATLGSEPGWICFVRSPGSARSLNVGRWPDPEQALVRGRAHIDQRLALLERKASEPEAPWSDKPFPAGALAG